MASHSSSTIESEEVSNECSPPLWLLSSQAVFAGWIAGGAGILVGHPFDTIKTLQQTQTTSKTSIKGIPLLRSVWSQYGVKGLYRGLAYPLITYGAVNAAFFSGAEYTRNFMVLQGLAADTGKLSYSQIYLVGCVGGVAQLPIVCSTELIKIKLQDQLNTGKKLYTGPVDATVKLWRQHGIFKGFYKGLSACILRDIYAWGFFLLTFEYFRDKMCNRGFHYISSELVAGGMAGAVSWMLATPFDVVKSRIQASEQKLKVVQVVKALYAEEGLKAFTRGMFISSVRGFPANAVTLFGFAQIMRWFENSNRMYYNVD